MAGTLIAYVAPSLLLSGCGANTANDAQQVKIPGTISSGIANAYGVIVVQDRTMTISSSAGRLKRPSESFSTDTISEGSAGGSDDRFFSTSSLSRTGFQEATVGGSLQLYDPLDNTIYETTNQAWRIAVNRRFRTDNPHGSQGAGSSTSFETATPDFNAGRLSVYEQQLHEHIYRVGRRTKVDGRVAVELVPVYPNRAISSGRSTLGIAYVTPGNYDPIRDEMSFTILRPDHRPSASTETVTNWSVYRVLPVTPRNKRLLSLSARHPTARVVHSASGYVQASSTENDANEG